MTYNAPNCLLHSQPPNMYADNAYLAPVVQKMDSTIYLINHNPVDNAISFHNIYPLNSDLSGGQHFPTFEQPRPDVCKQQQQQ